MQKQQGFTLVEMVIVIIILGVLAVTAAPKFINMKGDAHVANLQSVKASIETANSMVYAKALIAGLNDNAASDTNEIVIGKKDTDKVKLAFGYMAGDVDSFVAALDMNAAKNNDATNGKDWIIQPYSATPASRAAPEIQIKQVGSPDTCKLTYSAASAPGEKPEITVPVAKDC